MKKLQQRDVKYFNVTQQMSDTVKNRVWVCYSEPVCLIPGPLPHRILVQVEACLMFTHLG